MSNCSAIDCEQIWYNPPPLSANPDVSGIGVSVEQHSHLASRKAKVRNLRLSLHSLVTAYLTLALMIVHYVLVFDPEMDNFERGQRNKHPNPVDVMVLKAIAWKIKRPFAVWEVALEKVYSSL
jgi:hypothetical protein